MEVREGYKQTEVGVIPEEWKVVSIKKSAPLQRGFDLPNRFIKKGQYPIVYSNGILKSHAHFMVKGAGVVTGRSGTIGKVHYVKDDFWPHNTTLWVTDFFDNEPKYIYYLFKSLQLERFATGTGVPTLNRNDVHDSLVPIPPKPEQKAITKALSDVDALIESIEQLIEKKRHIKQGAMQELLTGKRRLSGYDEEWTHKKLSQLSEITMGQSPSSSSYNSEGLGLPLVQGNADIKNRKTIIRNYTNEITKRSYVGDIIMSVRAPVGEISRAVFDACIGRGVCAIQANDFLYHYLIFIEPNWAKMSTGSTFDSVNSTEIKELSILLPKTQEEQKAIATILSDMDTELETLETKLEKIKQIKEGMMHELLTGRIRLI